MSHRSVTSVCVVVNVTKINVTSLQALPLLRDADTFILPNDLLYTGESNIYKTLNVRLQPGRKTH